MRYVKKKKEAKFDIETKGQSNWKQFSKKKCNYKKKWKEHLLKEQNGRCIYCEQEIDIASSHFEHIIPQSQEPHKSFDYMNVALSCNGKHPQCESERQTCGHKKNNRPIAINPIQDKATQSYFKYGASGKISSENSDAKQTINELELNNSFLVRSRKNVDEAFFEILEGIKNNKQQKAKLLASYSNGSKLPFLSFMQYRLKSYR